MNKNIVTLDVRADIRAGRQPCSAIMEAVAGLKDGESLRLLAPFEPQPLYQVLGQQGLAHSSRSIGDGDWEVLFFRDAEQARAQMHTAPPSDEHGCSCHAPEEIEVDVRGLEPPQPMTRVLEALEGLPAATRLRARTDRRPMHLYPLLEARGFVGESEEQADGSVVTIIRRR